MDTGQLTAAPITVSLGGKEYKLSPLRDRDYGEYERWIQSQIINIAKDNLDGLPEDQQKLLLIHAFEQARKVNITSPEFLQRMNTVEGAAKLLHLMMRRNHPEMTEINVLSLLTDPKNLNTAMDGVNTLMDLDGFDAGAGAGTPKKGMAVHSTEHISIDTLRKNLGGPPIKSPS
jgi:hypothetical protein